MMNAYAERRFLSMAAFRFLALDKPTGQIIRPRNFVLYAKLGVEFILTVLLLIRLTQTVLL